MTEMTPWEDVVAHLLSRLVPLDLVSCPVGDAVNRAVAEDIVAPHNVPAFANSAMDGFAVRSTDRPVEGTRHLRIVGEIPAGVHTSISVGPGECARIMTGAMMPANADAIVPVERVRTGTDDGEIGRAAGRERV